MFLHHVNIRYSLRFFRSALWIFCM